MQILKKHKLLSVLLFIIIIAGCVLLVNQMQESQDAKYLSQTVNNISEVQYINCVAGLLADNNGGSDFVIYDTETWKPTILLNLPDVSPDNYGAISNNGKYIAYTKWNEGNARRYLEIYSVSDGKVKSFYSDMPIKNEIVNISWLHDNKTLLFIKNDKNILTYSEIQTLNVETGEDNTLVKGEVWDIRSVEDTGTTAEDFYLKGHENYLKVKEKKPVDSYDSDNPINPDEEWNYYLNQNDLNEIYHYYGGIGTFDIKNVLNLMYVQFSQPRCSKDGTKIIYSATLRRNSAPGTKAPLWVCSAIWEYDIMTGQNSIVYAQTDDAAIGRVDWIDNDEISYITYYDFQGSRDSVNYINLSTNEQRILFPYSDENYNNITLLPVGNRQIIFTSSKKDDTYENSNTILLAVDSNKYNKLDIKLKDSSVLLKNFIFTELQSKNVS